LILRMSDKIDLHVDGTICQRGALLAVILAISGGLSGCRPPQNTSESVFGSRRSLEIVQRPERVEASRLKADFEEPLETKKDLANYPTIGMAIDVPTDIASRVGAKLSARESYLWNAAKACIPQYGVRMSFFRGNERVDVLFCFECDILVVFHNGRLTGGGSFDYAHNALLDDVKRLFPDDAAIQALKASHDRRP
jgi:hypothetical protein